MKITGDNFFQTSDGARIYFEVHGEGTPLLMVPGFLCTTKFFQRNVGPLSQRYKVIVMDPRGQGLSSKTVGGNTILRNALDIQELAIYLKLERFVLLGWSMASSVALTYATQLDGGMLAGLVLVDGSLFPLSGQAWNRHRARDYNLDAWFDTYLPFFYDPEEFFEKFLRRISCSQMTQEDREWILSECKRTLPWTALEAHYDFCHTNNVENLEKLNIPVAFLGAQSEAYGVDMLYEYARHVRTPAQVVPFYESGHLLFYYEAEKFNRVISEFMDACGD